MSLDHHDHRALCQWRLSQPGEDRRADEYRATPADSPGLGAKREECVAPACALAKPPGKYAAELMAPNGTRAWNSGLQAHTQQLSGMGRMPALRVAPNIQASTRRYVYIHTQMPRRTLGEPPRVALVLVPETSLPRVLLSEAKISFLIHQPILRAISAAAPLPNLRPPHRRYLT